MDGVAETPQLPTPRAARLYPASQGIGILPDHHCCMQASSPCQSSRAVWVKEAEEQLLLCWCCCSVPFRMIPQSSEPQPFSRSRFPKPGG